MNEGHLFINAIHRFSFIMASPSLLKTLYLCLLFCSRNLYFKVTQPKSGPRMDISVLKVCHAAPVNLL